MLLEKEKMVVISIFSFPHNVFYHAIAEYHNLLRNMVTLLLHFNNIQILFQIPHQMMTVFMMKRLLVTFIEVAGHVTVGQVHPLLSQMSVHLLATQSDPEVLHTPSIRFRETRQDKH